MDFQQKVTELNEAKKQLKIAKDKDHLRRIISHKIEKYGSVTKPVCDSASN